MAKRFAFISFGVLCLVAAYQLGAERARAGWNPGVQGAIVGGHGQDWYDVAGQAWHVSLGGGFQRVPMNDLPVPVGSVKFMDDFVFVTIDDAVWQQAGEGWELIGTFPGGPISLDQKSWGSVKSNFK